MSNLDRSLDEILSTRSGRGGKRGGEKLAPGGIRKRPQRAAAAKANAAVTATAQKASSSTSEGSKIIVSNLPYDISETQIKEYFTKVVGPVKKCTLVYGPDGKSRGVATIVFMKPGDAKKAFESHNGVLVDKRPMKVELVVEAKPPGLEDRIGPINKPAPAPKKAKPAPVTARGRAGGARRGRGGRPTGRKPKTAEELDAEMADYFGDSNAPANAGADQAAPAPQAANGGDANMDEVL